MCEMFKVSGKDSRMMTSEDIEYEHVLQTDHNF